MHTGQPVKRSNGNPDTNVAPDSDPDRPHSASAKVPDIRVHHVPHQ